MRIYASNATALAPAAPRARRAASGDFSIADKEETSSKARAGSLRTVGGIDALMALQGVDEDPAERRRRSVKGGRRALDVLDELKLGLLGGAFDQSTLLRLRSAGAELKVSSGDAGLDLVLAEIDLRVEVELAKAGIR
ncbi:MAG TPA: flagellar assembly protein FliX [Xanthobacteraceae bacterium]|nr:flagellar assembly protein FliX [Xanthobacteraceae bacterium]